MFARKWFRLSLPKRLEIKKKITETEIVDLLFVVEMVLASVLATLGLLQNSVAIVIGAMLVAPLFRPIQALAYALVINNWGRFLKAFLVLLTSTLGGIIIGIGITILLPNPQQTAEIAVRTAPNILDLVVALVSAVIVFLSLKSERLADSVAGVAMAAALLPPLSVIGIEIALMDLASAKGAALLYLTNVIGIVLVGVIVLYMYGFDATEKSKEVSSKVMNIIILVVLTIALAVPLSSSLVEISQRASIERQASQTLKAVITETLPQSTLRNVEVIAITNDQIDLQAQLNLAESEQLFVEIKEQIIQELADSLGSKIELNFELLRVAQVISQANLPAAEVSIEDQIKNTLINQIPESQVISVTERIDPESDLNKLTVLISLPANTSLLDGKKEQLTQFVNEKLNKNYDITWLSLNTNTPTTLEVTPVQALREKLLAELIPGINRLLPDNYQITTLELTPQSLNSTVKNLKDLTGFEFKLTYEYPESADLNLEALNQEVANFVDQVIQKPVTIDIKATGYQLYQTTKD